MISALLPIIGSSGFGALVGWIGGLANRMVDLKARKVDLEEKKLDHIHELAMRDKDMDVIRLETDKAVRVATIEGDAAVEQAGYGALVASYKADKATYGIVWVDAMRGVVRPMLTLILTAAALYVNYVVLDLLQNQWPDLSAAERLKFAMLAVEWVFFQASVCVGWWFANRPAKPQRAT